MTKPINVLFLCTGNSARSILSEALLNDLGKNADGSPRFLGWSAGSHPSGKPHPEGITELQNRGHQTDIYRSKSWDEFSESESGNREEMDIVVTVCDNAGNEVCPVFPGQHISVHWPAPDPAHVEPLSARQTAFSNVYDLCRARIEALIALSEPDLKDKAKLQAIADITA